MPGITRGTFIAAAAFTAAAFFNSGAFAAYPEKPIRLVVPYGGGGMGSVFAIMVTDTLAAQLKSPVYAEYKPGANAAIGTELVAKSPADGYTLLMVTTSSVAVNPAFYANLRYDPLSDFTPVSIVWTSRNVLFSNADTAKSLKELIELGKTKTLNYGSLGVGSLAHLSSEMLLREAKIQAVHIPFKGQGQIMTEVAAGRLDFAFTDPSGLKMAGGGRVQPLAVTGKERIAAAPNIPAMAELGYPNVGTASWIGIMAPAGTPNDVVQRLSAGLKAAFASEEMKVKVAGTGAEVAHDMSPEYFDRELRAQVARWKKFQQETKIRLEQ